MTNLKVVVAGVEYVFKPLDEPLKEMIADHLVIMYLGKRNHSIKQIWMCDVIVSYDTQRHMEAVLVGKSTKWLTKDYGMIRVGHIDSTSVTFIGPDKSSTNMLIMGDTLYAVKQH